MARRTRKELAEMFKTGAQPTGTDFRDFIESITNGLDDKITKPPEEHNPVRFASSGEDQNLLDFFEDDTNVHTWRMSQNKDGQAGFNIEDAGENSRLFVKQDNGNIGISNTSPDAKVHIVQESPDSAAFRVDGNASGNEPFVVTNDGRVGIGTRQPDAEARLHVSGSLKFDEGTVASKISNDNLSESSPTSLPTEQAVRGHLDSAVMPFLVPVGTINMWSGLSDNCPEGWLICDGQDYLRSERAGLFAVVGTLWNGTSDPGEERFRVPDFRGVFPRGVDDGRGEDPDSDRSPGSYQDDSFQGHTHDWVQNNSIGFVASSTVGEAGIEEGNLRGGGDWTTKTIRNPIRGASANGYGNPRVSEETRPKNVALHYIIKA